MTNPRKLFVNFTISHLKMAGYEFLRTSRGGVMLQDSQQFQYYMKKNTPDYSLFVCKRYKKEDEGCPAIVHHLKAPCSFEQTGSHNHDNVEDITKTVIKDVLKNAAANPDLGTRNIFADLTVKVFWSS